MYTLEMKRISHLKKAIVLLIDGLAFRVVKLRKIRKVHIVKVVQALELLTLRLKCVRVERRSGRRRQNGLSSVEEGSQSEPGGVPDEVCTRKEPARP